MGRSTVTATLASVGSVIVSVLLAAAPGLGTAAAKNIPAVSALVRYETVYSGSYSFEDSSEETQVGGVKATHTGNATYGWEETEMDILQDDPHGPGFTEYTHYQLSADGSYTSVTNDGSGAPAVQRCAITGGGAKQTAPYTSSAGVAHGNPLLTYSWMLPAGAGYLGPKSSCGLDPVLPVTPQNGTEASASTINLNDPDFDDAFDGSGSVRYRSMPVTHPVHATITATDPLVSSLGEPVGQATSTVTVSGNVVYDRFGDDPDQSVLLH
jgi:hypothetical protein